MVNGDADKVVTMVATAAEDHAPSDAARIGIESDGAIETPVCAGRSPRSWKVVSKRSTYEHEKYGVDSEP